MTKPENKSTNDKKHEKLLKTKKNGQNSRTNGKSKAIQTKSHKEAYTYTLTKGEKGRKTYISFGKSEVFCQCSVGVL